MQGDDFRDQLQASLGQAYQLERELGGGMSRVFLAEEAALSRRVVIKVLPPDLAQELSAARFAREIRLAARLQHPHIVPLLGAGDAAGLPWFSMPYVEGESLRGVLARAGELPLAEAVRVLREVASALAYAHARGVVHRDIKPENVLLSEGAAMVADFGVAKALLEAEGAGGATLTSRGIALGTPAYMAPEQAVADPRADHRADLYAFGVLAYELLAGRTPFAGRSPQATLAAQVGEAPPPVEHARPATPPALAALVMQCLAKSPADRPQRAQDVVHALDALVTPAGTPASTIPAGAPDELRAPPPPRRRRRPALALGAALFVLAAGGLFAWARTRAPALTDWRIAVAPFENRSGDPRLDEVGPMAADWLTQGIAVAESIDVVPRGAVTAALADLPQGTDPVEPLARATRAAVVVWGRVYAAGRDSLRLQASLTDARTGRPVRVLESATAPRSDPMLAIEAVRQRLLGALAEEGAGETPSLRGNRAPKSTAYREFLAGQEPFLRVDFATAVPYFQRAIALDSTFVGAYFQLAVAYGNMGMWDSSQAVTTRLSHYQDRFTPQNRLMFAWQQATLAGDHDRALTAAQQMAARDSTLPVFLTGIYALRTLRARLALTSLLASDSAFIARRFFPQVGNLAFAYHLGGDHAGELTMLRRRRREFPNEPRLSALDLSALAALGRGAEARALADTLLRGTADPDDTVITAAVNWAAMEFTAHGDSATGAALARQVLAWHGTHPARAPSAARRTQQGLAWLALGVLDSAEQAFRGAARATEDVVPNGLLGVTLAWRGGAERARRARALADSLGAVRRPWRFGSHAYWQGAILAALGEREAAVRLLTQAHAEGAVKNTWHYETALRPLRGYPPFEALVAPRR